MAFAQPLADLAGTMDLPSYTGSGEYTDALLVTLRDGVGPAEAAQVVASAGATELAALPESRVHVVEAAPGQRDQAKLILAADPRVAAIEDDATVSASATPNDTHWDREWNMRRVRATEAWDATRGDSSVIIAIVDTGVDPKQPDLRDRLVRGWDFQNNDRNPSD
ncbi:MAG TPA: hypothetical protein VFG86_13210, partial [Chloroflexota bacterium]|nr:hypothetical protein [Chloroflexota bacterium]